VRQFQNKIDESVYTLLKIQIRRFGLDHDFEITNNKIRCISTGSEFIFYGLWRNIEEIRGMEGITVCWIEEGHLLSAEQWQILEPTLIRNKGYQFWIVFNPKFATDFVYKRFVVNPPPGSMVRLINYTENPYLNPEALEVIERMKTEDYDEYRHVYLGEPLEDDDSVIIKRSWIMASIDAHIVLNKPASGHKRLGFDVADSGADKCATIYAHGHVVEWGDMWKGAEDELLKSCTRVYHAAKERDASITYDSIGVGASCGAKFGEINVSLNNRVQYNKFNAGGAVFRPDAIYSNGTTNRDMFSNIKSQAWWLLADRFRNTYNAINNKQRFKDSEIISISSDLPNLQLLIDELSTPKRDYDQNGRVKVESKKDLLKREIASPNCGDALVCAFAPGITPMRINPVMIQG
jgi:phage terminase large subunit